MKTKLISIQEARTYVVLLETKPQWITSMALSAQAAASPRAVRQYLFKFLELGMVEVALSAPRGYRLAAKPGKKALVYAGRIADAAGAFGLVSP